MKIPLVDLKLQYLQIKDEIDSAIQDVINNTAFIKGAYVDKFESEFKNFCGVNHCIGVANGTDALYISLKSLGIGLGDEVITVANTWISTSETISQTGAKPVFIDIDKDFYTINVNQIKSKITGKTKAIIPVHLFGHPTNINEIMQIAKDYGLKVIEDCAQAHFSSWDKKLVGTFGDIGTFSFFPGKNLGAYGDAGGIITNNSELAEKIRMYANHGALVKHQHKIEGINSRLDGMQAAILSVKLKYLKEWTNKRIKAAETYTKSLEGLDGISLPKVHENARHVFHLYVIRINNRDSLINALSKNGVGTGIHYPSPLPFLDAYKYLNHEPSDFPISFSFKDKILSLPIFPEIKNSQIKFISNVIKGELSK